MQVVENGGALLGYSNSIEWKEFLEGIGLLVWNFLPLYLSDVFLNII